MSNTCGFTGSPDFYGLGIRLGMYLQLCSGSLNYVLGLNEEVSTVLDAHMILNFAFLVAIFVVTARGENYVIEIAIMLHLLCCGSYSMMDYGLTFGPQGRSWRMLSVCFILTAAHAYGSWFWIKGAIGTNFKPTPCGNVIFFFARLPAQRFKQISIFFAAWSVVTAIIAGIVFFILILSFGVVATLRHERARDLIFGVKDRSKRFRLRRIRTIEPQQQDLSQASVVSTTSLHSSVAVVSRRSSTESSNPFSQSDIDHVDLFGEGEKGDFERRSPKSLRGILSIIYNCVYISYTVVSVELMLYWNEVSGIYTVSSVGQLIPFIIGIAGVVKPFFDKRHHAKVIRQQRMKQDNTHIAGAYVCMQTQEKKWQ